MNKIIFGFAVFLFFGCNSLEKNLPIEIALTTNWQFKGIDTLDWKPATVPGNIFTDLLSHQIIIDPFIKNNEEKVQWVSDKSWEYKTSFTLSDAVLKKEHIELNFEGLDTYATIYLNDSLLDKTNNAFRTFTFDIKILSKKENSLRILFTNTDKIETDLENKNSHKLPEGKRIYTRKAQFQYGWDWGPKLNTSGIWKRVSIDAWDDYKIDNVYIKQLHVNESNASLLIDIKKISNTELDKQLVYEIYVNDKLVKTSNEVFKGYSWITKINIKNPKLWWTNNLGEPYLYNFKIVVKKGNIILDTYQVKKGIRTIKLITKKDTIGESFYFELNGKPVYMKGANYIPQKSFQNKVTHQHYEKLLSDVVKSNMNMLRVWGGGIYENDIFYDLCDKKGILIWQDFMFACAMYPGNIEFLANVKEEAKQQVKRLRNHASIALWCGNNENSEGWKHWGWQKNRTEKEKKEIWNDYLAIFDTILPKTVAEFSETDYWQSSPKYGRGNPKHKTEGDAHDWGVWHDAYPFEHFENNVPRFMSEFGFQSFPSFETMKYINQNDEVTLMTNTWKSHQKHDRGHQLIFDYMKRDYKVPMPDDDYIYTSQLVQAKGIVMGIEAHRRAKPYNMGTLYWQLNDCWAAISWSSIDYFGHWKALQYKAKNAFENVLISSVMNNDSVNTFVINDTFERLNGALKATLIDFQGKEIWSNSKEIEVLENSSQQFSSFPLDTIDKENTLLITEFQNKKSYFYFTKPKDLNLPKGEIQKEINKTEKGFYITLKSTVLQKDVFLFTAKKGHFSDNFFDVMPNETKVLNFKTEVSSLEDLQVKTLNTID
ncbi:MULTISPECIES: beta-mannosidase [unclassified Polaribacter]|uniref:beta-mannosidase n=1 Tax=unclassified Polaribacter TaxID=196858 RepID=UPI0011BF548D|nr:MULTISPECIES: glycoside hydrolase family 2 protein [unclassified Polaribacter]TXD53057.1 glycoside hydrolase family 2 protein [Polaribacter sp. IC063]TXD59442.1 glycoside hydrolase family 2 protein [Polaribacter sp. IC066]